MQCLYCHKRLGLFASKKRPFCSELHETWFHEEKSGSAIRRLLEPLTEDATPPRRVADTAPRQEPVKVEIAARDFMAPDFTVADRTQSELAARPEPTAPVSPVRAGPEDSAEVETPRNGDRIVLAPRAPGRNLRPTPRPLQGPAPEEIPETPEPPQLLKTIPEWPKPTPPGLAARLESLTEINALEASVLLCKADLAPIPASLGNLAEAVGEFQPDAGDDPDVLPSASPAVPALAPCAATPPLAEPAATTTTAGSTWIEADWDALPTAAGEFADSSTAPSATDEPVVTEALVAAASFEPEPLEPPVAGALALPVCFALAAGDPLPILQATEHFPSGRVVRMPLSSRATLQRTGEFRAGGSPWMNDSGSSDALEPWLGASPAVEMVLHARLDVTDTKAIDLTPAVWPTGAWGADPALAPRMVEPAGLAARALNPAGVLELPAGKPQPTFSQREITPEGTSGAYLDPDPRPVLVLVDPSVTPAQTPAVAGAVEMDLPAHSGLEQCQRNLPTESAQDALGAGELEKTFSAHRRAGCFALECAAAAVSGPTPAVVAFPPPDVRISSSFTASLPVAAGPGELRSVTVYPALFRLRSEIELPLPLRLHHPALALASVPQAVSGLSKGFHRFVSAGFVQPAVCSTAPPADRIGLLDPEWHSAGAELASKNYTIAPHGSAGQGLGVPPESEEALLQALVARRPAATPTLKLESAAGRKLGPRWGFVQRSGYLAIRGTGLHWPTPTPQDIPAPAMAIHEPAAAAIQIDCPQLGGPSAVSASWAGFAPLPQIPFRAAPPQAQAIPAAESAPLQPVEWRRSSPAAVPSRALASASALMAWHPIAKSLRLRLRTEAPLEAAPNPMLPEERSGVEVVRWPVQKTAVLPRFARRSSHIAAVQAEPLREPAPQAPPQTPLQPPHQPRVTRAQRVELRLPIAGPVYDAPLGGRSFSVAHDLRVPLSPAPPERLRPSAHLALGKPVSRVFVRQLPQEPGAALWAPVPETHEKLTGVAPLPPVKWKVSTAELPQLLRMRVSSNPRADCLEPAGAER